jgi:hypothetical protein
MKKALCLLSSLRRKQGPPLTIGPSPVTISRTMRHVEVGGSAAALALALLITSCASDHSTSTSGGSGGTALGDGSPGSGGSSADATSAPCGDVDQLCCATNEACNAGLVCSYGFIGSHLPPVCKHCGELNEICCPSSANSACAAGLSCRPTDDTPPRCAPPIDASIPCSECQQPGGQYCGRIAYCGGKFLDCGACTQPGFTCGGSGVTGLCGAARDSSACDPTVCEKPNIQYCGRVGDGCGSTIDCGSCNDGSLCGAAGAPNVCGVPPDGDWAPPPPLPPPPPPPPNLP